ncbi:hypothetical protein BsWGS_14338 [Bradybaena similaris]
MSLNMDFDQQSISSTGSRQHTFERPGSDIKLAGYLKKLKTMKKKYFVLRSTSSSGPARLEYYDSEKKFKAGQLPKRSIHLHTCFNINKKSDSRHGKHGIALYTSEDCFTVLAESEKQQEAWLGVILEFQNEYLPDGDMHKEHYDNVWQVTLQPRGLGQGRGPKSQYRLCLNSSTVSLVKTSSSQPQFTIQLVTIRSVAHHENSFRLEVGNYAPTGAGEFWFTTEDSTIAKDMHETLLHYMNATVKDSSASRDQRTRRAEVHSQPVTYCPPNSLEVHSPGSPNFHIDYPGGHRLRSDSRTSRTSKASFPEDFSPGFVQGYNGEHPMVVMREHCSVVPPDMSPPPSPNCLDDEINAYLAMDMDKTKQRSSMASVTSQSTNSSYLAMEPHGAPHKGEMSTSYSDMANTGYMSMAVHHGPASTHPVPCHSHSYSEPVHSTHLPTVKEGGSNEGYLPMDIPSSPGRSGVLKPEPAVCMLSDDLSGLPPRTYSLGSKPSNKYSSYMEMGAKKGAGNDMSRATSAPHILKGRREREHRTESPTPNTSPLSVSLKSDDSDSFMEYIPMRPRTSSDSFNYRNRTSSFGKSQQPCRPRSSSHGQGTRPVINFSKLNVDKTRPLHEASQRTSQESSLQGSFDSLRVSNESLRRLSQEMRHTSGSNASDYADMRGTPSPQMKNMKSESDHYVSMQVGAGGRRSPHRVRTDSSSSGRYPDVKTSSSDHLHHQPHQHLHQQAHQHAHQHSHQQAPLQHGSDYTEMAPLNAGAGSAGDSYFNMSYNTRHGFGSDSKSSPSASMVSSSHQEDPSYMNMHVQNKSNRSDGSRSLSMENVDTYIVFEPQSGNKPRTGSLGSKDKAVSQPGSARKTSSASVSSASSPSSSGIIYQQNHPFVSSSTRTGGSSDSIRKASRQSSMEKHGSLGKDFRKKSGSTGSRPSTGKNSFMMNFGKDHHVAVVGVMPSLKPSASKLPQDDPEDDEYIEFSPTATKGGNHHHHYHSNSPNSGLSHSSVSVSNSGSQGSLPFTSSDSFSSTRSNLTPSPADDEPYTLYNPAVSASTKSVHFQQQGQHNHHHPSQAKLGSSPSFTSSQIQQFAPKEADEYVGFEPGVIPSSSHASSHVFSNVKQVEAKDQPQYVGFEPGARSSISTGPQSSVPKPVSPKNQEEYVGYEPGTVSMRSDKPMALSSVMSYYQGYENGTQTGTNKSRQQRHSQHRTSMENAHRSNRNDSRSVAKNPRLPSSSSLTFDTPGQLDSSASVTPSRTPPVPPLSTNLSQQVHSVSKPVAQDANSDYLKFYPAESAASKASQENSSATLGKAGSLAQGSAKQQLSQLFVNVDEVSKTSAAPAISTDNGNIPIEDNKHKFQTQQQQLKVHQPPHSIYRQLSAPASQSSPVGKSHDRVVDTQAVQTLSPQTVSPDNPTSHRHKHLSSSSVAESSSPTGSGSRHKHWSGSSTSSQKSRKTSSDSEKSVSGLLGGKTKRRVPSGEKSPESAASLEAKIIPTEARIRHSLDDVTSVVGMVCKGGQNHGMVRPDSTPCIQNLATSVGHESRSLGDTPTATPRSGSTHFSLGPRSRHSLSDLGAYQQMNFGPSGVVSSSSDSNNSPGSKGSGSNSGINESSPADQAAKPLNYVKLDLGCLDSQGDADGKSFRMKIRNSSDADEKQPPLSYAEIDFVKSQNWNRTLPMGVSGDSSSSKS